MPAVNIQEPKSGGKAVGMTDLAGLNERLNRKHGEWLVQGGRGELKR